MDNGKEAVSVDAAWDVARLQRYLQKQKPEASRLQMCFGFRGLGFSKGFGFRDSDLGFRSYEEMKCAFGFRNSDLGFRSYDKMEEVRTFTCDGSSTILLLVFCNDRPSCALGGPNLQASPSLC